MRNTSKLYIADLSVTAVVAYAGIADAAASDGVSVATVADSEGRLR